MKRTFKVLSILFMALLFGCGSRKPEATRVTDQEQRHPTNVILLIGDGMGLTQISMLHQKDNTSAFSRFKNIGLINTSSASHKITDSAAGATAFSCGIKTFNGAIGVGTDSTAFETIVELYELMGKSTGVVSTSSVTHATPAAFYAHVSSRSLEDQIARQLIESDLDFFAGGGRQFFKELWEDPAMAKWRIDTTSLNFEIEESRKAQLGYLMAQNGMPRMTENRGTFLTDASQMAVEHLSTNKNGFFLMIEGSQIDWGGHAKDANYVKTEMVDFDQVINWALDFAMQDSNTLVVVTADHETGGLALVPKETKSMDSTVVRDYNKPVPKFNTGGHTSTLIPVFAYGPGSEEFKGIYENADIYHKIRKVVK